MKATTLYATLALVLGTPAAFSKSEVESLRDLCSTQKQQIQKLSDENTRLKGSKEAAKPTAEARGSSGETSGSYTVRAGDTLERIARKTHCSAASLGKVNNLKPETVIHPGLLLKLPGSSKSDAPAVASRKTEKSTPKTPEKSPSVKETKPEKLASNKPEKAEKPEAKPEKLAANKPEKPEAKSEAKPEPKPVRMLASNTPAETKTISAPKPSEPAPAPKTEASAETSKVPTTGGGAKGSVRAVIIQDETSFGAFASNHGISADRLNDLNGLSLSTNTVLAKGSELYIPAQP